MRTGWRNEPARHSLASRGIVTRRTPPKRAAMTDYHHGRRTIELQGRKLVIDWIQLESTPMDFGHGPIDLGDWRLTMKAGPETMVAELGSSAATSPEEALYDVLSDAVSAQDGYESFLEITGLPDEGISNIVYAEHRAKLDFFAGAGIDPTAAQTQLEREHGLADYGMRMWGPGREVMM